MGEEQKMAVEQKWVPDKAEAVIRQLRDVISARVVLDAAGEIEEVHILTQSERPPKQMVRDVESALMAHLGIRVDHKKVSVAQVQGTTEKFAPTRLRVSDVSVSLHDSRAQVKVRLTTGGMVYEGVANGHNSTTGQLRQVAAATLKAVEQSHGIEGSLILEDLSAGGLLAGRNVISVAVNLVAGHSEELLVGSALVKQDSWKAVVNATLDAVNRRLSIQSSEG